MSAIALHIRRSIYRNGKLLEIGAYRLCSNGPPIGNGIWVSNGHVTDDDTWFWKVKLNSWPAIYA